MGWSIRIRSKTELFICSSSPKPVFNLCPMQRAITPAKIIVAAIIAIRTSGKATMMTAIAIKLIPGK